MPSLSLSDMVLQGLQLAGLDSRVGSGGLMRLTVLCSPARRARGIAGWRGADGQRHLQARRSHPWRPSSPTLPLPQTTALRLLQQTTALRRRRQTTHPRESAVAPACRCCTLRRHVSSTVRAQPPAGAPPRQPAALASARAACRCWRWTSRGNLTASSASRRASVSRLAFSSASRRAAAASAPTILSAAASAAAAASASFCCCCCAAAAFLAT